MNYLLVLFGSLKIKPLSLFSSLSIHVICKNLTKIVFKTNIHFHFHHFILLPNNFHYIIGLYNTWMMVIGLPNSSSHLSFSFVIIFLVGSPLYLTFVFIHGIWHSTCPRASTRIWWNDVSWRRKLCPPFKLHMGTKPWA